MSLTARYANVVERKIVKHLILILALFGPSLSAQTASVDPAVQHAAATVAHLHDTMLDPGSFVLDGAYVTLPNRIADKEHKNLPTYCYAFRSHNAMGGYSEGRAYEDPIDHGKLVVVSADANGNFGGYDSGWVAPCKAKHIDRDITTRVAAAALPLYRVQR
jgi:hypothetical protein